MLNVTLDIAQDGETLTLSKCVLRYDLREGLSELFELNVEVLLTDPAVDPLSMVGREIRFTSSDEPFHSQLRGIVRSLRQLSAEPTGGSRYEILIAPGLWLSTRRRDHRIFQDKSVIEIAQAVVGAYGGRIDESFKDLCTDHPPREYCVQYAETDHELLSRILADEGICTFFDHHQRLSAGGPGQGPLSQWSLLDDTTALSLELEEPVHFVPPTGQIFSKPHVQSVLVSSSVETSAVTIRDYDFENPSFNLEAKARVEGALFHREADLEAYTYHVGQFTTPDGKSRASQLLDEARGAGRTYRLETTFALAPGTRLTLTDHPNDAINGSKLVVRARTVLQMDGTGRPVGSHLLDCVDADVPYRPRRGPKPRIHGTQTAFVVGKRISEDEIDVDKYGRVKVHFTWDRRDSSFEGKPTRFIRVSQGWAGQGYGFVMLPRVGDEVIVSYLDGDPDEPIIIGRVHNAVYTSPLNLTSSDDFTVSMWKSCSSPADKGSSEDRFNLVRMQDKAGEEMLELRAQRDFRHKTLHDYAAEVGHNQSIKVTGSQSTSAGSISGSAGTTHSMSAGTSLSATAGTSLSLHAGDGLTVVSDTNLALAAGTTLGISSSASMSLGSGDNIDMSAGATWTAQGTDVFAKAEGTATVKGSAVILVATGDLSAHGKGSAALTSSGTSTVDAPNVNITGGTITIEGGTINIKGGTVNINS